MPCCARCFLPLFSIDSQRFLGKLVTSDGANGEYTYRPCLSEIGPSMLDAEQQIRFTQLWTAAQPVVHQFVASLVRDPWASRDIVQNTSLKALQKFPEYDESRAFLPWALGIAKFEILGHQRDSARNRLVGNSELLDSYTQAWADMAPPLSDEAAALQHCMGKLKGRARTIIKLRYATGQNSDAIANDMNLTSSNVRTILKRTRQALRKCIENQGRQLGVAR